MEFGSGSQRGSPDKYEDVVVLLISPRFFDYKAGASQDTASLYTRADNRTQLQQTAVTGKRRTRLGLPITIETKTGPATVLSCPDTGSEENIISEDLAQSLGLAVSDDTADRRCFELANGKRVLSVGRVKASCSFGTELGSSASALTCGFYVFRNLCTSLIMGLNFLKETKTLTSHRERLVRHIIGAPQALRVRALSATQKVICKLNGEVVPLIADSRSDLNLMSPEFARKQGYVVEEGKEELMFADGSLGYTSGVAYVTLSLGLGGICEGVTTAFHILRNLAHDVLLGEDSLEEFEVFTKQESALYTGFYEAVASSLNRIIHLGPVEGFVSGIQEKVVRGISRLFHRQPVPVRNQAQVTTVQDMLNEYDQRENSRREREAARIASLIDPGKRQAAEAAEAVRQDRYHQERLQLLQSSGVP